MNDSGVDATHPDLTGRMFGDSPTSLVDSNGHGTHVAGIIASSGINSMAPPGPYNVGKNTSGSVLNADFRGLAPGAFIYSLQVGMGLGPLNGAGSPWISDEYLQEAAAQTNALVSNNSWTYGGDNDYDLAAASYDAAVRDALPRVTGSQPLLMVFAAGNGGGGDDGGLGGNLESIESPGTAKNVITVGAIEQPRYITNASVLNCQTITNDDGSIVTNADGTPLMVCQTNRYWLGMTDSGDQVASFSSRGNVGIGIEGDSGRFKPDLVAPGTFVVSTRSAQWNEAAYYNPTNYDYNTLYGEMVTSNNLNYYSIFVPYNAVEVDISVGNFNPTNVTGLPIYVNSQTFPTTADFQGMNRVALPVGGAWPANTEWAYAIGNTNTQTVSYDLTTELITTNDNGDELTVLSNLNNSISGDPDSTVSAALLPLRIRHQHVGGGGVRDPGLDAGVFHAAFAGAGHEQSGVDEGPADQRRALGQPALRLPGSKRDQLPGLGFDQPAEQPATGHFQRSRPNHVFDADF